MWSKGNIQTQQQRSKYWPLSGSIFLHIKRCRTALFLLDRLQTRRVQSQEVLPTRLLLAQYGDKSGIASALLALCSSFFLFLCLLSLSFRTFFGITLFMSGVTPPLFECLTCLSFTSVSLHHSLLCIIFGIFSALPCPPPTLQPLLFLATAFVSIFALNPTSQPSFSHLIFYCTASHVIADWRRSKQHQAITCHWFYTLHKAASPLSLI